MSRRHIYIFTLAEHSLTTDTLPLTDSQFVPQLIVHDAVHGIAQIELANFRESAVLIPFWRLQIEISGHPEIIDLLSSTYLTDSIASSHSNSKLFECQCINLEMDGVMFESEIRLINLSISSRNARFYIRFPLFLSKYKVSIRVRCQLITSSRSWSAWTKSYSIHIPCSMISKAFDPNDAVLFTPSHSNHSVPGKIVQKVNDNHCDLYQVELGRIGQHKCFNVPSSRIYRNGPSLKHVVVDLDKRTRNMIYNALLLSNDGKQHGSDLIFDTLSDIYQCYAEQYCDGFRSIQTVEYPFIGNYVAKHVLEFVLDVHGQRNMVKCILNDQDGYMRVLPVWHSSIENHMELLRFHRDSEFLIVNPTRLNTKFSCDLCGVEISGYQWMFECNGGHKVIDKHFMCLICGYNIMRQYTQILNVLDECLSAYFYDDCIRLIAAFVCGSVFIK